MNRGAVSPEGVRASEAEKRAPATSVPTVSRSAPAVAPSLAAAGLAPSRIPAGSSFPDAALAAGGPLSRPSQVPVGGEGGNGAAGRRYPSPVLEVVGRGGGQPLGAEVRADMEARLGPDFSDVRVHTDDKAAGSAGAVAATAYTVGSEVIFGHGYFDPASPAGRHRLAHELVHVQQQRQGPVSGTDSGAGVAISDPADAFEREAEATAARVMSGPPQRRVAGDQRGHHAAGPSMPVKHVQRSPAGPTASPEVNTPESIAGALASVTVVDKTQKEMLLRPQEMFALVPSNVPAKAAAFSAVYLAVRRLRKAEQTVKAATASSKPKQIAAATAEFEAAQKGVEKGVETVKAFILKYLKSHDAKYQSFVKEETGAKAKLAKLEKPSKKALSPADQAKHDEQVAVLKSSVADLDSKIKSAEAALSAQVDAGNYGLQSTERHYYTVTVDGETISIYDHVEAYATTMASGVEGKARGEGKADVATMVETSGLSASRKKILKTISSAEGGFTSVNTWDRATLTWGFVQWTGGDHTDLTAVLSIIKRVTPDAFQARFAKYGIDVVDNKLVVTNGSGTAVKGSAAASTVQASPLLTAIISRAGMDPDIQKAEIMAADQYEIQRPIDRQLSIEFKVPKSTPPKKTKVGIRLGDVLTSEYAVGVVADQTVHGGMGSFLNPAKKALQKFADDNDVEAADVKTWAGQAETAVLPAVIQWPKRAKAMADAGCSKAAHSFS